MSRSWSGRRATSRSIARPRSRWRRFFDYALTAAILGLLILLSARLDRVETRNAEGRATVNDGDSITLGAERIRLRGIDAPEFNQICLKDGANYPCGRRARDALIRAIGETKVVCSGWQRDRYGRMLASCMAGGKNLNRLQVENGWAVAYGEFEAEETAARLNRTGLWAGTFDRPREWRDQHGDLAEIEHGAFGRILDWLRQILGLS
jgi:endonuclease YncB( thermonuclease family)